MTTEVEQQKSKLLFQQKAIRDQAKLIKERLNETQKRRRQQRLTMRRK